MRYHIGNIALHALHLFIIMASMFAWIIHSLQPFHLLLQLGVLASWVGYGLWDGSWGRCIVTVIQWHWKEMHQRRPTTDSYIDYWIHEKLGLDIQTDISERFTIGIFLVTSVASLALFLSFL